MGMVLLAMTIGGLIIASILLALSYFASLNWLRTFVLGGVTVWLTGYVILLFIGSIFSEEKTLTLNEPKEFCGFYFDCHLHTTVSGVRKTKTIADKTANGEFYIIKAKVFSDAKQASLGLISVDAKVVDAQKREYRRDLEAEKNLGDQLPFDRQVLPNESFEKEIVFDLPENVKNPRLDIREGYGIDHAIEAILIGDEDSILHKRKYFDLNTDARVASY